MNVSSGNLSKADQILLIRYPKECLWGMIVHKPDWSEGALSYARRVAVLRLCVKTYRKSVPRK